MLATALAVAAFRSPRNKLAFRIGVSDRQLQRVYDTHVSNPLALRSVWCTVPAAFFPLASCVTLITAIRALRRVDPNAWPPRGGRTPAWLAIGLSVAALLGWVTLLGWAASVASAALRTR